MITKLTKPTKQLQFHIGAKILVCQIQSGWFFEIFVAYTENRNFKSRRALPKSKSVFFCKEFSFYL